jgi:hypothetical protein
VFKINYSFFIRFSVRSAKLTHNVVRLGEGGAIEAQNFNFAQKLNRRTTVELCSFAPLLQNPCYQQLLF